MTSRSRLHVSPKAGYQNPEIQILSLAAPIRHALKALSHLASRPDRTSGSEQVARALRLPAAALSKSFQRLAKAGLLESQRGPGGGYRLAADPAKITLAQVAVALDVRGSRRGHCVLEDRPCEDAAPCALHHAAKDADARLRRELARLTLADLSAAPPTAGRSA